MISSRWGPRKFSMMAMLICIMLLSAFPHVHAQTEGDDVNPGTGGEGAEGGEGGGEGEDEEKFDTSFCGDVDCYDVLGLRISAAKSDIKASYRELSLKWHPDKNVDLPDDEKRVATDHFAKIGLAYKILNNKDSRERYDHYISHPEQYRRRAPPVYESYAPESDARLVLLVMLVAISAVQYASQHYRNEEAKRHLMESEKVLKRSMELMHERGQVPQSKKGKSVVKVTPAKVDQTILKQTKLEVVEEANIGGGFGAPDWKSLFAVQICMAPYHIFNLLKFHGGMYYRHQIRNEPYTDEEKVYLTRKCLNMTEEQWDNHTEDEFKQTALEHEVYVSQDNFKKHLDLCMQSKPGKLKKLQRMKKKM